jgi:hypothetical protein
MDIEIVIKPHSMQEAIDLFGALERVGVVPTAQELTEVEIAEDCTAYDAKVEHNAKPAATEQADETAEFDVVEAEEPKPTPAADPTVEDLRAAVRGLIGRGGQTSWINDFLHGLDVASVHDLNGTQRASLLEAINAR